VSDESSEIVENYSKANAIPFLLASDPGGGTMQSYGARGYPSAYLIDPSGKVAWQGHPAGLKDGTIKKALKNVRRSALKKSAQDKPKGSEEKPGE
jgi:peroxiredoxin